MENNLKRSNKFELLGGLYKKNCTKLNIVVFCSVLVACPITRFLLCLLSMFIYLSYISELSAGAASVKNIVYAFELPRLHVQ